jgi:hypothetical protein
LHNEIVTVANVAVFSNDVEVGEYLTLGLGRRPSRVLFRSGLDALRTVRDRGRPVLPEPSASRSVSASDTSFTSTMATVVVLSQRSRSALQGWHRRVLYRVDRGGRDLDTPCNRPGFGAPIRESLSGIDSE